MTKKVFETSKLGEVTLKNRFIRSAVGSGIASEEGYVTESVKEEYKKVANGGAAMIITGSMSPWDDGNFLPNQMRIDNDSYIDGLRELAEIIHEQDSKIIAQIGNAGSLYQINPEVVTVGPSEVKDANSGIMPKALPITEIETIVGHFVSTANRAKKAGIDGVQLHVGHGSLLYKFVNPYYNRRTDAYGVDTEGRSKIIVDITEGIRKACGSDFLTLIKINSTDAVEDDYGFTFEESRKVCNYISKFELDAIEISSGLAMSKVLPARSIKEVAYNLDHAKIIADEIDTPVIVVGGIRSLSVAEDIVNNTNIYAIGMTRALINNPTLIKLWEEGQVEDSKCICCNKCFTTKGEQCVFRQTV